MRISELAARTGVPLATVKYYLREELLMPGRATSATQAQYDDAHVRRLGLVRALAGQGLPLDKIKVVVALVEDPGEDLFVALGKAVMALPPYPGSLSGADDSADAEYPRTRALLERLGQLYDPRFTAVAQLERALAALDSAGLTMSDRRIDVYGEHIRGIADLDVDLLPTTSRQETVEAAVLGTALYEPVLAAMRRLAHQHRAARTFSTAADPGSSGCTQPDRHPQETQ
ncbi:MerR family transcriptional regulator [Rhodococcus sp. NPDC060090]|uniref:MerR family transcriptional regulator n=1 Tax=Rhodococcus sp. NPDC060090 TaxID=3347056 RepID=UPI003659C792